MNIGIYKLYSSAKLPTKGHDDDIGFDLYAHSVEDQSLIIKVGFGIAVKPPDGYHVEIAPRSSIYKMQAILSNSVGVIHPGYTGELMAMFYAIDKNNIAVGDRVAQMVLRKSHKAHIEEIFKMPKTSRGSAGFGSTGKK